MMTEGLFFDTLRQGILAATSMSLPMLAAALIVGVVIGLLQALTSIQEMTLTFVPKLACALGVLWFTMAMMTQTLVTFFTHTLIPLIQGSY